MIEKRPHKKLPKWPIMVVLGTLPAFLALANVVEPSPRAYAQGPFPTVPPPDFNFPTPFSGQAPPQPVFEGVGAQSLDQATSRATGLPTGLYLGGGTLALVAAGVTFAAWRKGAKGIGKEAVRGGLTAARKPHAFEYRPRLARIAWIAPLGGSLLMFGLAAHSCQRPQVCYAMVGGIQIVVPCEEAEGSIDDNATATADAELTPTPSIDCPDPGRGGTDAYETAKAGGKHSGYLNQARNWATSTLLRALDSYEANVFDHAKKMVDPSGQDLDTPWSEMDPRQQQGLLKKWCTDLIRNRELADVMYGILRERGIQS